MNIEIHDAPSASCSAPTIPFAGQPGGCSDEGSSLRLVCRPVGPGQGDQEEVIATFWAYDADNLHLTVRTPWEARDGNERAWRYGDGLLLTVSDRPVSTTTLFTSIGLAGPVEHPQRVVVNSSGRWFPPISTQGIAYQRRDYRGGATYRVSIPWSLIPSAHGSCSRSMSVNLTYTRLTHDGRRFYQLVEDRDHDAELTRSRVVLPVNMQPRVDDQLHWHTVMSAARMGEDSPLMLNLGLHCPQDAGVHLGLSVVGEDGVLGTEDVTVDAVTGEGKWVIRYRPSLPTGRYQLRVQLHLLDTSESRCHPILALNQEDVEQLRRELKQIEVDGSPLQKDAVHCALFRLDWLEELGKTPPWEIPELVPGLLEEARDMYRALQGGETPEPLIGVSRRAFRSEIDGSLQPYSMYLPAGYHQGRRRPLLVFLHGSGVDEQKTAADERLHRLADTLGMVLLFPCGRDLSGFYLGDSEGDVLDALEAARRIVSVDPSRIYLAGFSMGGFGTWHTGLRHVNLFSGLAVFSGTPCHPIRGHEIKEGYSFTPMDHIEAARTVPLLVVHGSNDPALPIGPTREIVEGLRERGVDITFRELPRGHGDYDPTGELGAWLQGLLPGGDL